VPAKRRRKHHPALKKVGARVRAIRHQRKFSQEVLAHRAHLERAFVSGLERGEFNVSVDALGRIADALDTEIGAFFDFE
jgi:transcriptional regulator with XRE-family HTH domain